MLAFLKLHIQYLFFLNYAVRFHCEKKGLLYIDIRDILNYVDVLCSESLTMYIIKKAMYIIFGNF